MSQSNQDMHETTPSVESSSPPQHIPTSADIARKAQVSRATVSYVLNNTVNGRISEETRLKVRAAAAELGYTPHALARSLRARSTNVILMPLVSLPPVYIDLLFFAELTDTLKSLGYVVLFYPDDPASPESSSVNLWASLRPAGVLLNAWQCTPQAVTILRTAGVRGIIARGFTASDLVATILNNQTQVGAIVAEHLIRQGHQHLGMVVPPTGIHTDLALERWKGFEQVCTKHNVAVDRINVNYDQEEVIALAKNWRSMPRPTGIFTYSDDLAALFLSAFLDAGLRIPEDVALVGSDDLPLCTLLRPQLSTVRFSITADVSKIATFFDDLIQQRITGTPSLPFVTPQVIARASG